MAKAPALILSSGGLHSLVAAGIGSREYRIAMLFIKDGRESERHAQAAFERQVAHFKPMKYWAVDGSLLRQMTVPPESAGLVNSTCSDPQSNLLPTRELQFLAIAAGFARQIHAQTILWGAQYDAKQNDALARNMELVQVLNQLLEIVSPEAPVVVKTPLMGLEDQQVIELGYQMALPFGASWTCQMPMDHPCMSCPACTRRTRAFRAAQLTDPLVVKTK